MSKIAIVHGSWFPNPDNETGWELAITPIVQTYCETNSDRFIPEGHFSLVNLTNDSLLDKALENSFKITVESEQLLKVRNKEDSYTFWTCPKTGNLTLHNLGLVDDDGEEYSVYLMIPNSVITTLKDRRFEWDGMWLLRDIEIDRESKLDDTILKLLKQVTFFK